MGARIYIYIYTYLYDWSYKDRDEDRLTEAKQVDQREFHAVLEAANVRFRVYIGFKGVLSTLFAVAVGSKQFRALK